METSETLNRMKHPVATTYDGGMRLRRVICRVWRDRDTSSSGILLSSWFIIPNVIHCCGKAMSLLAVTFEFITNFSCLTEVKAENKLIRVPRSKPLFGSF